MKKIVILTISVLFALAAQAVEFNVGNLKYTTNEDGISVCLTGYVTKPVGYLLLNCLVPFSSGKNYVLTSIGDSAFYGCSGLSYVSIPTYVTSIGTYAFFGCSRLNYFVIENSTPPAIDTSTFGGVEKKNVNLYIPFDTKASYSAADVWDSFQNIEEVPVSRVDLAEGFYPGSLFSLNPDFTSASFCGYEFETVFSYNIPSEVSANGVHYPVTAIEADVFYGCADFVSVVIPDRVTLIKDHAFSYCADLRVIVVRSSTPPSLGNNVFIGVNKSTCKLYVPAGSKEAYAAADQWKDFQNISESVTSVPQKEEASLMICKVEGGIIITGAEPGATITVYTITGTQLLTLTATGNEQRITLPGGALYIVKVGSQMMKVAL